ncbi:vWA domain-containing protein [Candidatus Entotheonella palauensis]|uniref:vWA domain-containing protein n=1 Tax=Candidatus Entotheonella palauensis TaxID=93172 RepID=UPI000B7F4406|nr:VWA domain-containing protein [Candidatus Entotheonella palauensis]
MRFGALSYLYLIWLVPALIVLSLYSFGRKRKTLAAFMNLGLAPQLLPHMSRMRPWLKAGCLIGAVACLIFALMQPQWGRSWQDVPQRGRDMMILLDVSRSMLVEDIAPNRLERAKSDIKDLVQILHREGGHRIGLVAFAGRASLQCPLTLDYAFFLQKLNAVGPYTAGRGGTLIGDAIRQALHAFGTLTHNYKDIILITDGEDHESFPLEAAQAAAEQDISIYTIGIGDPETGSRIPVQNDQGERTYVRYDGREVQSRMQENLLLQIAERTGGAYVPAGVRAIELDRIYTDYIAPKARRHLDIAARERYVHRFQWFILAALLLLGMDICLQEGNFNASPRIQEDA